MAKEKTINERYQQALETFNNARYINDNVNLQKQVFNVAKNDLSRILLFGKAEACTGLAYIYKHGLSGTQSNYNEKLFLVIGKKLGNKACIEALEKLNNLREVEDEAQLWVEFIEDNTNKKGPNDKVTGREIVDICARLCFTLKDNRIPINAFNDCYGELELDQIHYIPQNLSPQPTNFPGNYNNNHKLEEAPPKLHNNAPAEPMGFRATAKSWLKGIFMPEPAPAPASKNTITTTTTFYQPEKSLMPKYIEPYLSGPPKTISIGNSGSLSDNNIACLIPLKLNNITYSVTAFRAITFPDKIKKGETFKLEFALSHPNGARISEKDPAYLTVNYDYNGNLIKLAAPNAVTVSLKALFPVLTIYHGNPYTLPVNSSHYKHLTQKVIENGGVVEIGHADSEYHLEFLG